MLVHILNSKIDYLNFIITRIYKNFYGIKFD